MSHIFFKVPTSSASGGYLSGYQGCHILTGNYTLISHKSNLNTPQKHGPDDIHKLHVRGI